MLLMNPTYMNIGPAVNQIEVLLACWGRLAADGSGPALDAGLVQNAKAAIAVGVDTVGTTFALFHLYHRIPKEVINIHINQYTIICIHVYCIRIILYIYIYIYTYIHMYIYIYI